MLSFEFLAVATLIVVAAGNLVVGVINDAVNFLGPAIGSKVSSKKVIVLVGALGIIVGATFSDGVIEVARKGIFHPEYFTLREAIILFTAVALADLLVLDLFSTFGLPTSTTVSVIFELFGAALGLAWLKTSEFGEALNAINSESAIKVFSGIFISIVVAFFVALVVQFLTRLFFTFDYKQRLKKFGFIWCGICFAALVYFILIKGGKHASFLSPDQKDWISEFSLMITAVAFVISSIISWVLIKKNVDILKIIILMGTCASAVAFAGNDLANFIGVSIAGTHAFLNANLASELPTPTWVLLSAGILMSTAMYFSRKADTVTGTSIKLASHSKDVENSWGSNRFVSQFCKMISFLMEKLFGIFPKSVQDWIKLRFEHNKGNFSGDFDYIRACVSLIVSSAIISLATANKLPLSTTFVTFIVVMATALADGAWNKNSAPNRVTGVLTVISGWLFTAFIGTFVASVFVSVIYLLETWGLLIVASVVVAMVYVLNKIHRKRHYKMIGPEMI